MNKLDPSSRNWLPIFIDEYLSFRAKNPLQTDQSADKYAYSFLHQSGLFYGTITSPTIAFCSDTSTWSETDKFKISITKGIFDIYSIWSSQQEQNFTTNFKSDCLQKIHNFYVLFTLNDALVKRYRTIFSKDCSIIETIEAVIDLRISNPTMLDPTFWKGSQFNIFSGLDVLYFALWLNNNYCYDHREQIKLDIVSLITQVSKINNETESNANAIASYFLSSGIFSENQIETIKSNTYSIKFDEYVQHAPLVVRRLLYDYTTFPCLVDKNLNVNEVVFLDSTAKNLHLSDTYTQESMTYVDDFVTNAENNIFYLHYGEGIHRVQQAFYNRMLSFITKNKKKIVTEVLESKELVELLRKSMNEKLSNEEKTKVWEQIFDILKTIPSLAIFMIPGGAVILPLLLKILPEEVIMPSSFVNKKKDE